jgi:hypothetical protein
LRQCPQLYAGHIIINGRVNMNTTKRIKHCKTCHQPYSGRFCANRECPQRKKSIAARRASQRNSRSSSRRGHFGSFGWGNVSASASLPNVGPSASNQIVANAGFYANRSASVIDLAGPAGPSSPASIRLDHGG